MFTEDKWDENEKTDNYFFRTGAVAACPYQHFQQSLHGIWRSIADAGAVTGLHVEAMKPVVDPDQAESSRECTVNGFPAA